MNYEAGSELHISGAMLSNYFEYLVNHFFKILPMYENCEATLWTYMKRMQAEMVGCKEFVYCLKSNPMYMSLLAILQYLMYEDNIDATDVKREVFEAISICNKLKKQYADEE